MFQSLCSNGVSEFLYEGKCLLFFFNSCNFTYPFALPLNILPFNIQYWLYLSLERRHATNRKEL